MPKADSIPVFGVEPWWARVVAAAAIQNLSIALPSLSTDSHVFHMWQVVRLKQSCMLSATLEKMLVWPGQISGHYVLGSESPAHDMGTVKRGVTHFQHCLILGSKHWGDLSLQIFTDNYPPY